MWLNNPLEDAGHRETCEQYLCCRRVPRKGYPKNLAPSHSYNGYYTAVVTQIPEFDSPMWLVDDAVALRKERFFYRKSCCYCGSCDMLQLDSIQPFTWVDESVWTLSDWEFKRLFVSDIQILCDPCLRRKKQVWKQYKKEGGNWLEPYLIPILPIRRASQ